MSVSVEEVGPRASVLMTDAENELLCRELFSTDRLFAYAPQLAGSLEVVPVAVTDNRFSERLEDNARVLQQAHAAIAAEVRAGQPVTPDVEWLLDNFYVVEEQIREIREDLPQGYFEQLPKLANGEPRVYRMASELIVHTDNALDRAIITGFVQQFQTISPLSIGEMWALPIMLRLGLVENLRRLAAQMLAMRRCRAAARTLVVQWQAGQSLPEPLTRSKPDLVLAMSVVGELGECLSSDVPRLNSLRLLMSERFPSKDSLTHDEHQRQAADQVSIGNVITSMRLISALDWVTFFEECNLAEQTLRRDPAGIYAEMDFESRDRYRHAVESLARQSRSTDVHVAERAVARAEAARQEPTAAAFRAHVGYWLVDAGRIRLEQDLSYRPRLRQRLVRAMLNHPYATYFGGVLVTLVVFVLVVGFVASALAAGGFLIALLCVAALVPLSEVAVQLTNSVVTRVLPPRLLPKLKFERGIPENCRTMVVLPSMLTGPREVAALLDRLEVHYLANTDPQIRFALLTDFADAPTEHRDDDQSLLDQAVAGIRALNTRYGTDTVRPFCLFHRFRQWNQGEKLWMGWERKRGKLMEFNGLLRGDRRISYAVQEGDLAWLLDHSGQSLVRFVITLDADTQLPHGTARRLIGTLAHPLNLPVFDSEAACLSHGYVLLQPRVNVQLADANRSWYARIFANSKGIDPYSAAASDVYQDLFGEGSFTGKGIYHLDGFQRVLEGAFPENQILSHDLIEGCHARVALVSDIELIDGFPSRYDADARRQHRWVRGDWQILPWLFGRVPSTTGRRRNPLSALSHWKIFDNARRSLVAPALTAFLLLALAAAPQAAWWWSLIGLFCLGLPTVLQIIDAGVGFLRAGTRRTWWRAAREDLLRSLAQTMILVSFLPHRAYLMCDAVLRTLFRMGITRRRMLEWETAAATEHRLSRSRWSAVAHMWFVPVFAVIVIRFLPEAARAASLLWIAAWFLSPAIAHIISRPFAPREKPLADNDRDWLRSVARRTWGFFEAWVGPEGHWLPPDNLQEYPHLKLAQRVSPTNEGMYLVSALAARDFGYLGLHQLIDRWEQSLASWNRLAKYRGHPFNWYDTTNLEPLAPRYISTVDSGNLAACLLVLRQAAAELCQGPVLPPTLLAGLADTRQMVEQACDDFRAQAASQSLPSLDALRTAVEKLSTNDEQIPTHLAAWSHLVASLRTTRALIAQRFKEFLTVTDESADELSLKVNALLQGIDGIDHDFRTLLPWVEQPLGVEQLPGVEQTQVGHRDKTAANGSTAARPRWLVDESECSELWKRMQGRLEAAVSLEDLATIETANAADLSALRTVVLRRGESDETTGRLTWIDALSTALHESSRAASALEGRYFALGTIAEKMALEMDFSFLYDTQRRLFVIGYNFEDGRMDRSHYDMLCSEARLSSFFAIAKGDVAPRHWFQLGRQATFTAGQPGMLSWGGTMFEFLMPLLFQHCHEGSLLDQACRTAVARQQEYGRQHGIPWGSSECAFGALAVNSDYHYQSFGVPGLGLKRGLSKDLVVAPYATMLALEIDPHAAVANLRLLAADELLGDWGFYEAVDFTPGRASESERRIPVRCYMAHHAGMSFLALANLLLEEPVRRRFHSHPLVRATELLLQERVPAAPPLMMPHSDETEDVPFVWLEQAMVSRRIVGHATPTPRTHLLSNGKYAVMVTNVGSGYSRWEETAVTRWRPDATCDSWGQFLYLRDQRTGEVWSPTYQPVCSVPDAYEVIFSIDKAEFRRRNGDIETVLEVAVSPEDQVEVRQIKITNHSRHPREFELTSFAEVVLTTQNADLAHPAFQKLFIETEFFAAATALLARRRPRESHDAPLWAFHVLSCGDTSAEDIQFESSRAAFLGRGRTTRSPTALDPGARLTNTTGMVIDPVFSLRCRVSIEPQTSVSLAFCTGIAQRREDAVRLADKYHDARGVHRAFELAWAYNQVELHHLHLTASKAQRFQRLAASLLYPDPAMRGSQAALMSNEQGQSGLWRFGISGDRPIALVKVSEPHEVQLAQELLNARAYWAQHGLKADLVVINDHPASYLDALQEELQQLINRAPWNSAAAAEGVFLLRGSQLPAEDKDLLEATASLVLDGVAARNRWQMQANSTTLALPQTATDSEPQSVSSKSLRNPSRRRDSQTDRPRPDASGQTRIAPRRTDHLEFWNGVGGFAEDGNEYHILSQPFASTPMPWSNVIANPRFGFLVTESGGGFTWAGNSRENKLTVWANDPVSDPPSEVLYVRDDETDEVWMPCRGSHVGSHDHWVRHGQGYTRFVGTSRGLEHDVLLSIAPDDPVKFITVSLKNTGPTTRSLSLVYFAQWVLGPSREQTQMHVVTELDAGTSALFARNSYHSEESEQVAFLHVLAAHRTVTGDRTEFLGRNGELRHPAALRQPQLSNKTGAGLDPCGAVQTQIRLAAGETREVVFLLGAGSNVSETRMLLDQYDSASAVRLAVQQNMRRWKTILQTVQVRTPNRALDLLVNRWLIYQILSCRIWGRSAYYQSGGAYGFRDQLQDVMAMVYSRPDVVREHLLRAASRQYEEGDVQHWWHPPTGRGTRTRFSDDLLWLPLSVVHYITVTGDDGVLDVEVPYLTSPILEPQEQERYELPRVSARTGTLYEHCVRTLQRGCRFGAHGLPLMGCGDWNDGMNKVGAEGRGESVWVGWFLLVILDRFLPVMERRDDGLAADFRTTATELRAALETHAWDGAWYRRAYFDDGSPLGSHENDECQIDSIVQSWAVLAKADPSRTDLALDAVFARLVRPDDHLVALFDPPFDTSAMDPGYIKGYLPGVRENGGQYTHAVLWLIEALTMKGDSERALAIFDLINPIQHTRSSQLVQQYQVEPYVMAADVYSVPPHTGRGGWTWYTGSAAYMYRVALESLLGFTLCGSVARFSPCVPADWSEFRIALQFGKSRWSFLVRVNVEGAEPRQEYLLSDDEQDHDVIIEIGPQSNH